MVTTYFLNLVSGNLYGSQTNPPIPSTYYIGLSSTEPELDGSGVTEPSANDNYSRVPIASFGAPDNGVITNTADISFNESIAAWGTMTHYVIYDSIIGGNLLIYNNLAEPRSVESSTILTLKAGNLKLNLSNTP